MNINEYVCLHHLDVLKIWAISSNRFAYIKIFDFEGWCRIDKDTYNRLYKLGIPTSQKLRYLKGNK